MCFVCHTMQPSAGIFNKCYINNVFVKQYFEPLFVKNFIPPYIFINFYLVFSTHKHAYFYNSGYIFRVIQAKSME